MLTPVANYSGAKVEPIYPAPPSAQRELAFIPGITIKAGTVLAQISTESANEVQTLDFGGSATGGTFTLSIDSVDGGTYTTNALAYNITNANLKTAIEALLASAGYAGATVTIGGGACPTDATVTFGGTAANWNMPLMVATSSLTGTNPTLSVAATTAGNKVGLWCAYDDDGTDDGRRTAKAIATYSFRTDNLGRVVYADSGQSPDNGAYSRTAPAWFKGVFKTTDLTGLDDNAVADLGRLESGTTADGVLALI